MAPQLAVQNTFLHVVDDEIDEEDPGKVVRAQSVPVLSSASMDKMPRMDSIEELSTDSSDGDEEHGCITREFTFDAFEMPCNLCDWVGQFQLAPLQPSLLLPQASAMRGVLQDGFGLQVGAPSEADKHARPGTARQAETGLGFDTSCMHLPGGVVRMQWEADSRRFAGRSAAAVSPTFLLDLPGLGAHTFKIIVQAAAAQGGARGGRNFQATQGHAAITLKCESQIPSFACKATADTYVVVLDKAEGTRLGLDLESRKGESWWIKSINAGLIAKWNLEHPEERVNVGDSILEVNGVSGDLAKVREACTQRGALRLVFRRVGQASPSFDVRFGIGGGTVPAQPMRGPVRHDFSAESCCDLPTSEGVWDLLSAVDRSAKKVRVVCEISSVQPLGSRP
mmetsp:Transcript_14903/g.37060  ORF Transcript_14903/g.37060 Transcript_14903/m.37060 type:complete len:395 (-) Transcript_14903:237-1421(-)